MERLRELLNEPSTYGGLAILLGIVLPKAGLDAGTLQTIGAGLAAVITIVMKETGGAK